MRREFYSRTYAPRRDDGEAAPSPAGRPPRIRQSPQRFIERDDLPPPPGLPRVIPRRGAGRDRIDRRGGRRPGVGAQVLRRGLVGPDAETKAADRRRLLARGGLAGSDSDRAGLAAGASRAPPRPQRERDPLRP